MLDSIYMSNTLANTKIQFAKLKDTSNPNKELVADILYDFMQPGYAFDTCSPFENMQDQWTREFINNNPELMELDKEERYLSIVYLLYSRNKRQLLEDEVAIRLIDYCLKKKR